MAYKNLAIIVGNMGKDPELRKLENDNYVTNFSVATTKSWRNSEGEKIEKTEWHNVVLWRQAAEYCCSYAKKGMSVMVEGELQTRSWEDDNGKTVYRTELVGREFNILTPRDAKAGEGAKKKGSAKAAPAQSGSEDLVFD